MAKMELKLTLHKRVWVSPLLEVAAHLCALTSFVSEPVAERLSKRITTFIAKYGFRVQVR